ncbi:MAG: lipopolysaccharide heptosyltransferase II [Acidiferrobacteraceae bacterium]
MQTPPAAQPRREDGRPRLKVLVVGPSWVGDLVMAQSLFKLLHARGAAIDLVANPQVLGLAHRMPEVQTTWPLAIPHGRFGLRARRVLARTLRDRGYHWSIVLPNSWKSALLPFFAGIPRRTGYTGEWRVGLLNDRRRLDEQRVPRMVDRYAALGLEPNDPVEAPCPSLLPSAEGAGRAIARLGLPWPGPPVLGLCPGAEYGPAKRWPAASFAALATTAHARGWQVWLFGARGDTQAAHAVRALAPDCVDLTGKTTLEEVVDLISLTSAIVTNDSGLMHVAAAVRRPLVALFGSSNPEHTPPLAENARVLTLSLSCSPCFERVCPLGHTRCLVDLAPDRVLASLAAVAGGFTGS